MKFKLALFFSIVIHVSIFAIVMVSPGMPKGDETTYYVDIIQLPPGSGGAGPGGPGREAGADGAAATVVEESPGGVKDLAVERAPKSDLRYPDRESKRIREDKEMFSVVRKPRQQKQPKDPDASGESRSAAGNVLSTGISAGSGPGGEGAGWPGGLGDGAGFPYAYYIDTLRNKISANWYTSLVTPGARGKYAIVVYFKIFRDGSVGDLKFERESGITSLDLSARRAVENAAPFAPLPADFPSRFLIVHFKFEWGDT